jgi:hypothetical protein
MTIPQKTDGHRYLILGSGNQGVAAAYDALLFGDAAKRRAEAVVHENDSQSPNGSVFGD